MEFTVAEVQANLRAVRGFAHLGEEDGENAKERGSVSGAREKAQTLAFHRLASVGMVSTPHAGEVGPHPRDCATQGELP